MNLDDRRAPPHDPGQGFGEANIAQGFLLPAFAPGLLDGILQDPFPAAPARETGTSMRRPPDGMISTGALPRR
jgi:hypothetical protein